MLVMQGDADIVPNVHLSIMVVMELYRGWKNKQPQQGKGENIFCNNFQWYNSRIQIL